MPSSPVEPGVGSGGAVAASDPSSVTVTVAVIGGWMVQKYWYVPELAKVKLNVSPC